MRPRGQRVAATNTQASTPEITAAHRRGRAMETRQSQSVCLIKRRQQSGKQLAARRQAVHDDVLLQRMRAGALHAEPV